MHITQDNSPFQGVVEFTADGQRVRAERIGNGLWAVRLYYDGTYIRMGTVRATTSTPRAIWNAWCENDMPEPTEEN